MKKEIFHRKERKEHKRKNRNISRKGAKHVLSNVEGAAKENRSELGVLGALARKIY